MRPLRDKTVKLKIVAVARLDAQGDECIGVYSSEEHYQRNEEPIASIHVFSQTPIRDRGLETAIIDAVRHHLNKAGLKIQGLKTS
jgi:hypothetical protein